MRVDEALAQGVLRLPERRDAQRLLCYVLNCRPTSIFAFSERLLTAEELDRYYAVLERRRAGEPLAYIEGRREFYSREFLVSDAVLIPRHETELLVEHALKQISERRQHAPDDVLRIADIGCGSGIIGISVLLEAGAGVTMIAGDCMAEALVVAKANAQRLQANVHFVEANWLEHECFSELDFILSNPPYIACGDVHLALGDLRFEPLGALVGGEDGLTDLRRIINDAPRVLKAGGELWLEHGFDQNLVVCELLLARGFVDVAHHTDLAGLPRISGGRWPGA